jgi:hypothetical protein
VVAGIPLLERGAHLPMPLYPATHSPVTSSIVPDRPLQMWSPCQQEDARHGFPSCDKRRVKMTTAVTVQTSITERLPTLRDEGSSSAFRGRGMATITRYLGGWGFTTTVIQCVASPARRHFPPLIC